jgi:hypothetical protein
MAGAYGELEIDGSDAWQRSTNENYNIVHINCLSLLCRRLDITPEDWWMGYYGPDSPDRSQPEWWKTKWPYGDDNTHLKEGIEYYEMWGRNGQDFEFTLEMTSKKGNPWYDPEYSYEHINWVFASPSIFIRVPDLPAPLETTSASTPSPFQNACHKVIYTPDLFFTILDWVAPYIPQETVTEEMIRSLDQNDCPSVIQSIKAILLILQVNKRFHNWIIQSRQDLFFRLVWQMGFMLPACPLDWKSWNAVNDPLPPLTGVPIEAIPWPHNANRSTTTSNAKDWRAYLLRNRNTNVYAREEDRHTDSRRRLHRLLVQHARGLFEERDGAKHKYWSCGKLGVGTALECPEPYEWEKEGYTPAVDFSKLGDGDLNDPTESDASSDSEGEYDPEDGPESDGQDDDDDDDDDEDEDDDDDDDDKKDGDDDEDEDEEDD